MNLRTLKKLSKRAAPLLPQLGDNRQQFLSEEGDNYHGLIISARKHWERCSSIHTDCISEGEFCIAPRCREGRRHPYVKVRPPAHPWPRTVMVGAMQGYYEPEWDEESAYGALRAHVFYHFTDYSEDGWRPTRRIRTPRDVFAAAGEMIAVRAPRQRDEQA
jgi:hypothetical protein